MRTARSRIIGILAALFISWWASYWLISLTPLRQAILFRIGFMCAVVCAFGALTVLWGLLLSYAARNRKWSPLTCRKSGISVLLLIAPLFAFQMRSELFPIFYWSGGLAVFAGYVCRKLAHPELSDDEAYASEPPLTLFPK